MTSDDFIVHINGIESNDKLNFQLKSYVSDSFGQTGKLTIFFYPEFKIPDSGAFISLTLKNSSLVVDDVGNPLTVRFSNQFELKRYDYIDPSELATIEKSLSTISSGA